VLNEHAVTAVNEQIDSNSGYLNQDQISFPGGYNVEQGVPFYAAAESPYNVQSLLNTGSLIAPSGIQTISSTYGKPLFYQLPRTLRIGLNFSF